MKARRCMAWIVTALMLLTSIALPGPLSAICEAEAATVDAPVVPAAQKAADEKDYDEYGWCGDNLFWEFDSSTGKVVITGSGDMYDYDPDWENPWVECEIASQVKEVSLPRGLTRIGDYAFYSCTALTSINLPSTVKTIGEGAFNQCQSLVSLYLPKNVTLIDTYAFTGCTKLRYVYYQSTADQRVKITIRSGNNYLLNANWTYTRNNTATLAIKTQPKSIQVNEGNTATFRVKATGATRIDWQYQKPGSTAWNNTGVTAESYTVMGSLNNGYRYRARVSNGTATLTSSPATLTVKQVALAIKSDPRTVKTAENKKVTFRVNTAGATHIQWLGKYADDDEVLVLGNDQNSLSLYIDDSYYDGMEVWAAVSNDRGGYLESKHAQVLLRLSIANQPKNTTINEEEYAWFYVGAPGATDLQWQYRGPNSSNWTDWSEKTSSYLCVYGSLHNSGFSFRCRVSNLSGVKYSNAAKLTVKPKVHYRALLIGESNYSSKPLAGASYNVDAMNGMLKGLNNSFTTTILKDASRSQILNGISTAFSGASDYDVSLFYYSGHGGSSSYRPELGALCPISGSWIWMYELANKLSNVKGRVIVVLNSCHSGAAIGKGDGDGQAMEDMLDMYNQSVIDAFAGASLEKYGELATSKFVVITASAASEVSWAANGSGVDGSGYPQSFFTAALIKGMGCTYPNGYYSGSMPADKNKDKLITLKEIYNYSYNQTLTWNKQRHTETLQHVQYYGNASEVLFRRK